MKDACQVQAARPRNTSTKFSAGFIVNWAGFGTSCPPFRDQRAWVYVDASKNRASSRKDQLQERFGCNNYNFVPIVLRELKLLCHVDILFLRPDVPGQVLKSADIDNRLKPLIDALKMPASAPEMGLRDDAEPPEDESPFFVLLEDDSLITRLSVETDTLLEPTSPDAGAQAQDARLIITVRLSPYERLQGTMGF